MKREHTRPYSYTTCTPLCLSKFHADRNGTQYEQIVSFEVSFREVGRGKGEGKGEEALSPGFRCNSLQSDIVKYRPMRVSRMLNSYTRKHTHTDAMYTRVEFDFSNSLWQPTRDTRKSLSAVYRSSVALCHFIVLHSPSFLPIFFPFSLSVSLSLSTLSAVTRHASTRFVSFVSNNCRQQNGTMRMQMIPFKLAHGSIFICGWIVAEDF